MSLSHDQNLEKITCWQLAWCASLLSLKLLSGVAARFSYKSCASPWSLAVLHGGEKLFVLLYF